MKNNQQPELRFPGFNTSWKDHKLGEFLEDFTEKTVVQNQYPVLTSSQKYGIVFQEDYFANRQVTTDNNIGYFILPKGYITYRSRSDNNVFVFNRNDLVDKGIISYFYPVFKITNGDSDFFLRMLNSTTKKQVASEAVGTGQKVLSLKKLKNINITIPEVQEQEKIGEFFKRIDEIITNHLQELATLKQTKQGFLQKMFPKEGETVPKLRFSGFSGAWEESEVKDFSENALGGGTPRTTNKEYWDGNTPWIQSSDLNEHQVSGVNAKKRITESGLRNSATKLVSENSIAIVTRVGVGKIALMEYEYTTSQDFLSLSNLKVDKWFGVYSLYTLLQKELHKVQGTSIKGITKNELLEKKLFIPTSHNEQAKIGNFFKEIDVNIALQQQELKALQQTKKAFLQKMFI